MAFINVQCILLFAMSTKIATQIDDIDKDMKPELSEQYDAYERLNDFDASQWSIKL